MGLFKDLFKNSIKYESDVIDLVETIEISEKIAYDKVPAVYYSIFLHGTNINVGNCDLRLKMDVRMYYFGHVGYKIKEEYRGHNYAYYTTKLLFSIAKDKYNMDELIVTCDPDNIASYKTLVKLKGELVEVAEVPYYHELYKTGARKKCIFKFKLNEKIK